jgi:hypothetical protein
VTLPDAQLGSSCLLRLGGLAKGRLDSTPPRMVVLVSLPFVFSGA